MADIIVNTSPLQYLHQAGQFDLFQKLSGFFNADEHSRRAEQTPATLRNILDLAGE